MRIPVWCFLTFLVTTTAGADTTRLVILERWNRPTAGGSERMTTTSAADENPGGTYEGAIAYIAADPGPGRAPLYRLYDPARGDHMDSLLDRVPGYVTEDVHGYMWTAPRLDTGATFLFRWLCLSSEAQYFKEWTGAGAVILASDDLQRAIGLYGRKPSAGGSTDQFQLFDGATCCAMGTGQFDFCHSQVDAARIFTLPAGDSSYTTYIASGTLEQIRADFRSLFRGGL